MQSPIWVRAREIDQWAGSPEGKVLLPELVRRLVRACVPREQLSKCDFPAEAETHRSGYDGTTATTTESEFVPSGVTYWELGSDADPDKKAEDDYKKRLQEHESQIKAGQTDDISQTTFVAVTARDWHPRRVRRPIAAASGGSKGNKTKGKKGQGVAKTKTVNFAMKDWAEAHTQDGKFKQVRAYDSNTLEQWLSEAPAVGLWLAGILGKSVEGVWGINAHWLDVQEGLRKPLGPEVLLVDRSSIAAVFDGWLKGLPQELSIYAPSPMEVVAVFAAWVQTLPDAEKNAIFARTIVIENRNAWWSLVESRNSLVLVAAPRLESDADLFSRARRNGHWVLRHVDSRSSRTAGATELPRMRTFHLQEALAKGKLLAETEAKQIARAAGGNFTILRRVFAKSPAVQSPAWAKDSTLARMLLAGAWDDSSPTDQKVIEQLTAQQYEKAREVAALWKGEADPPLRLVPVELVPGGVWEFNSPMDAWEILHHLLGPSHIAAFSSAAVEVLSEENPALSLAPEDRPMAQVRGKVWKHSHALRQGVAEMLAIMSSRQDESGTASNLDVAAAVASIVRQVLPEGCSWKRWASLGHLLPSLVEAAPEEFLTVVEDDLATDSPQTVELLKNEIPPEGISGAAYHSGLLWALETAGWAPQNYRRVALILVRLTELDPGGRWGNRPASSAERLFFSARPQTMAPLRERIETLKSVCSGAPMAGWKLSIALMPRDTWGFSDSSMPRYRNWAAGWGGNVTYGEYDTFTEAVIEEALKLALGNAERWSELLQHAAEIFATYPTSYENLVHALEATVDAGMASDLRDTLWEQLRAVVTQHEQYSGATWALPKAELERFKTLLERIAPADPITTTKHLFSDAGILDGDEGLTYQERVTRIEEQRRAAIAVIWKAGGAPAVQRLANAVANAFAAGIALAQVEPDAAFPAIVPAWLSPEQTATARLALGFASELSRLKGVEWTENACTVAWTSEQRAAWALVLPFEPRSWKWLQNWENAVVRLYWTHVQAWGNERLTAEDIAYAVDELQRVGRAVAALELLMSRQRSNKDIKADWVLAALDAVAKSHDRPFNAMSAHHIREAFRFLQLPPSDVDRNKVAALEFTYLPLLSRHFLLPKTLMWGLSSDPALFIECLTLLYKPHAEANFENPEPQARVGTDATPESKSSGSPGEGARRAKAQRVWQLLHDWNVLPGTDENGVFVPDRFTEWVTDARARAKEVDRLEACDVTLGQLFAKSPADVDGAMPLKSVRDVLELSKSRAMESGFTIGLHNARGTYGKDLYEGGKQERDLAESFEKQAKICAAWPRTARTLRLMAKDYLRQAEREDERAKTRD